MPPPFWDEVQDLFRWGRLGWIEEEDAMRISFQLKKSLSLWFKLGLQDFCRTMRQINTSASSTGRSDKSNPMDALQTCRSSRSGIWKSVEMCREVNI